jgi:hypothetical protein
VTVYILDWTGTLSTLKDPKGYIRALQHVGHKVIIWSGHMTIRHPAAAAADQMWSKMTSMRDVCRAAMRQWPDTAKFIVSDDDRYFTKERVLEIATEPELDVDIEFLDPFDLQAHLSTLA